MGNIKVILNKDIINLGEEGDIKLVKRGYARNYLFPKDLACDYSERNVKILDSKKEYLDKKKENKRENAEQLKEKLEAAKISIEVPAGDKGRLYGTVTSNNIGDELTKLDFNIDKRKIDLKEHIKFGGTYKYRIHLYESIYAEMELEVIAKEEKHEDKRPKGKKFKKGYNKRHFDDENTTDISETENTETEDTIVENKEEPENTATIVENKEEENSATVLETTEEEKKEEVKTEE